MNHDPVFDQVNLVVRDMAAMVAFYQRLGVEFEAMTEPWDRHHRPMKSTAHGVDVDLDSTSFAQQWNAGWPAGATGVVLGFRLASREAVDEVYRDLTAAGYAGQQEPYDTFWGARYAILSDPDGNAVGLMSPVDESRRTPPPDPPM